MLETVVLPSPDPWLTFFPDVLAGSISGLVTGLVVGAILFALQVSSERRSSYEADVSSAYRALLEVLADMVGLDFRSPADIKMFGALRHRMTVLSELVDTKTPEISIWFEAERQRSLYRAEKSGELVKSLTTNSTMDQRLEAIAPFSKWVTEFSNNVRYWRLGKLPGHEMAEHASAIEIMLRKESAWNESMSWVKDGETAL
jgi:hypothetical protein